MISIQIERWDEFYADGKEIFPIHYRELALHQKEIPLDIDEERYTALDQAGILLIVTARDAGSLVGYWLWFLMPHGHNKSSGPMGLTDMYFVLPGVRNGTGVKLLIASQRELERRGVRKAISSCKAHQDHRQFFESLGWELSDYTMVKLLKGDKCP